MTDDLMPFDLPKNENSIIKVMGVGGGGSNAVNHMYRQGIKDVNFVVCNTDAQALVSSPVPIKIQLGESLTEGRGAGNKPETGREAAIENINDIVKVLEHNTKMVFITAGMGGGTGTGAAPIIAKAAKEMGILTVGIVTIPFKFEGERRIRQAVEGINELSKFVDSLLVIRNEKLREITGDLPISKAFSYADNVLTTAAKGIAEIITQTGQVNVDFADVQTVMTNSGVALMGTGSAAGEDRAMKAVQLALNSPLLSSTEIKGAKNVLLNICSGETEASMDELYLINDYVQKATGNCADLIWGSYADTTLGEKISVTVIATGFETDSIPELYTPKAIEKTLLKENTDKLKLNDDDDDVVFEVAKRGNNENRKTEKASDIFGIDDNSTHEKFILKEIENEDSEEDDDLFDIGPATPTETGSKVTASNLKDNKPQESAYNKSNYSQSIEDYENTPAYRRKDYNIKTDTNYSRMNNVSRYTLSDDDETLLNGNNPYLHDNVD